MTPLEMKLSDDAILIMRTISGGWYPMQAAEGVPLAEQAKDHGDLNKHLCRIEDLNGNVLWERAVK